MANRQEPGRQWASQMALMVKHPSANTRDIRDTTSTLGSGRSPGGVHGNPLQYSSLQNPLDRGAGQAIGHEVAESRTGLKRLSPQAQVVSRNTI